MTFDPYHTWLGIPSQEQPANYYRLLGLRLFEDNPEVIDNAADRQMAYVRTFNAGRHASECERLLNELSNARVVLLDQQKKAEYDEGLRPQESQLAAEAPTGSGVPPHVLEAPTPLPELQPLTPSPLEPQSPHSHSLMGQPKHRRRSSYLGIIIGVAAAIALVSFAVLAFVLSPSGDASTANQRPAANPASPPQTRDSDLQSQASNSTTVNSQAGEESEQDAAAKSAVESPSAESAVGVKQGVAPSVARVDELVLTETARFAGHTAAVTRVDLSSGGRFAASVSKDQTVRVWDTRTAEQAGLFRGHAGPINDVRISADGRLLASTCKKDKTLRLWSMDSGQQAHVFRVGDQGFGQCDMSDDGRWIITGGLYFVRVFDGLERRAAHAQKTSGYAIAMSSDGTTAAFGGWHKIVHINRVQDWKRQSDHRGHTAHIYAMSFCPDQRFIASAGPDRTVRILDLSTGKTVAVLKGHKKTIHSVAISRDAERAVSAAEDATFVWDIPNEKRLHQFKTEAHRADISADGRTVLTGHADGAVRLWQFNR